MIIQIINQSHNPYFNRWFSAILSKKYLGEPIKAVTILILIDGFLQFEKVFAAFGVGGVTILILIDGFLQ